MSYTKQTLKGLIEKNISIQEQTMDDNDLTPILSSLNSVMEVAESFSKIDADISFYWNEIVSELIAVIHASISGYNRLALSGLRNVLELSCHVFYYHDHKIELKIAESENSKADKYVSALIRDHSFFMTKYIAVFNESNNFVENKTDGFSSFLKTEYAHLCDVVHGRNSTLFKKDKLSISYEKDKFKQFEKTYLNVSGIISTMYLLRFNKSTSNEMKALAIKTKLIKECV